jgi:uncharacterized protein
LIFTEIGIIITSVIFMSIISISFSIFYVIPKPGKRRSLLKFSIKILDFFYLQLKIILKKISPSTNIDHVMIEAKNELNRNEFEKTKKRILLAPHCLRSLDCPAPSTQYGLQCELCGQCQLSEIKQKAENADYSIFILAGSSFIKSLIDKMNPEGILLLGCPYEVNKVMMALDGFITYGITLSIDGCVNTSIDSSNVFKALELGKK